MILPWLKTGGEALLREGVGIGLQVAQDKLGGRNVGDPLENIPRKPGSDYSTAPSITSTNHGVVCEKRDSQRHRAPQLGKG